MNVKVTITYDLDYDTEEELEDDIKRIQYYSDDWFGVSAVDIDTEIDKD